MSNNPNQPFSKVATTGEASMLLPFQQLVHDPKVLACRNKLAPPGVFVEFVRSMDGKCVAFKVHYATGSNDIALCGITAPMYNQKTSKDNLVVLDAAGIKTIQEEGSKFVNAGKVAPKEPVTTKTDTKPSEPAKTEEVKK